MSGSAQRNLTLTEELEKLEQSITLTLQEIDSNFSRAHRIVTTSILPVVEQYAEQSKDVWEGAKFWKQFFESSANVSLSGYEEQPNEDNTEHEQTVTEDSTVADTTTLTSTTTTAEGEGEDVSYETPSSAQHLDIGEHNNELDFSSLTISPSHSTPRPTSHYKGKTAHNTGGDESPSLVAYPSPYHRGAGDHGDDASALPEENTPVTPGRYTSKYHHQQDLSETPMSSPFIPPSSHKPSTAKRTNNNNNKNQKPTDPVLHHVLDKTYRVQATPLSKQSSYKPTKFTVSTPKDKKTSRYTFDDSPISSPEMEAPKLHEEIFSSPMKGISDATPGTGRRTRRCSSNSPKKRATPRPGVSVLTPGKPKMTATTAVNKDGWDSDDDDFARYTTDDDDTGAAYEMSPPKTMQFHIPQSRLMKTPAKEASKRIVSGLLAAAGGGDDEDDESYATHHQYYQTPGGDDDDEAYSPTVVRSGARIEDDTF